MKQGYVGSPDLFNCITDHLITWTFQRITGVTLGNHHLIYLEYADDITLFSDSVADLVAGLSIFEEEASKFGPHICWKKTKLMHSGDGADSSQIVIGSTTIDIVDPFSYLRSLISSTGDLSREFNQCCGLATMIMQSL